MAHTRISKPTPGPWTCDRKDVRVDEHGGLFVARCYAIPCEDHPDDYDGEREANARLIAAAPDLLSALKETSFRLAALVAASGDFSDANAKALDAATAALAKAE